GFRRIYMDVLENEGYNVLEADDGEKGFKVAKSEKPGLILLDIVLPTLSGFEVLKKIRGDSELRDMPIIIFSVLGDKETIKKGLDLGANDYTVKGFYTPREILSKIRDLLVKSNIRSKLNTYQLAIHEIRADASKLQQDVGISKTFECPRCKTTMVLELIPDYTRADGHWFVSHFVCPECKIPF
ncbi:MAG: response regulator, partial [Candidatus Omnitrophica bacterium]|nr:response regulator [Candidatus Omnitrophota bacterium]